MNERYCPRLSFAETSQYGVAWPAQNMPVEYFGDETAWSVSMGSKVDESSVSVRLTDVGQGRSWNFSSSSKDGAFYVDNGNYGRPGCIIFRPSDNMEYRDGDVYQVEITGLETPSYQVRFFSLAGSSEQISPTVAVSGKPSVSESKVPVKTSDPQGSRAPEITFRPQRSAEPIKTSDPQESEMPSQTTSPQESKGPQGSIMPGLPGITSGHPGTAMPVTSAEVTTGGSVTARPTATPVVKTIFRPVVVPDETKEPVAAPSRAKLLSLKNKKGKRLIVKIRSQKDSAGYQVQYGIGRSMKNGRKVTVWGTSVTIKGLKKGKTYYVRARAFRSVSGKRKYGVWSKSLKQKIRK